MALVRNDFVQMDWDAEYFATKNRGTEIVYAGQVYAGKLVLFRNGVAFAYYTGGRFFTPKESVQAIKHAYKNNEIDYLDEFDEYLELADIGGISDSAKAVGFTDEECEDILLRLKDLSSYGVEIEESIL